MRKFLLILLIIPSYISYSQISTGGVPYGLTLLSDLKSAKEIPVYNLQVLNRDEKLKEDSVHSLPLRYSIFENVNIDIKNGLNRKLPSGNLWQYKIRGTGAFSLQLIFSKFVISDGAKIYIYDENIKNFAGGFTYKNMQKDSSFVIADFKGDNLIIEYFEPYNSLFKGQVVLAAVGKAYLDISAAAVRSSFTGINCPEGRDWQNQKHSVCMISFRIGLSGYLCSGALINDVTADGTPYFLTASHCVDDSITAKTMVAYFNDEELGCSNDGIPYKTLSGASLLTTNPYSDYALLKLDNVPPPDYKPYYSGWDVTGEANKSLACIHHPFGEPKKILLGYTPPVSYNNVIVWIGGTNSPPGTHWQVKFSNGKTQPGSSGSPLFNEDKRIIGQLHGGDYLYDYFGMMNYSWTHSSLNFKTLKEYLDPENSGNLKMDGFFPPTNLPDPQFYIAFPQVCTSTPIALKNNSVFDPSSFKWTFSPDSITYNDGTDSASENPVVAFNKPGFYRIKLLSTNNYGTDSIIMDSALIASDYLNVSVDAGVNSETCKNKFDSIIFTAKGASSFDWNLISGSDTNFYFSRISQDTAMVKKINSVVLDSINYISVNATGHNGNCSGDGNLDYPLIKQKNDNIENAILIKLGNNGPFSNLCSSIQNGEPVPPHYSCTSQDSWCNEINDSTNEVEHSVWFKIIPQTSHVTITSSGFDCQLAFYKAATYSSILSGSYLIMAANDDRNANNQNSQLLDVPVSAGETYWLQVDGSKGGLVGSFNLFLTDNTDVPETTTEAEQLSVFPQPFTSRVYLKNNALNSKKLNISVYSSTGAVVYNNEILQFTGDMLDLNTENWYRGLYIVQIVADNKLFYSKLIKK